MTFKQVLIVTSSLLLLMTVWGGCWSRLASNMSTITRSDVLGDEMVVEYRMLRPFTVEVKQCIRPRDTTPRETGIHLLPSPTRTEQVLSIASSWDFTRGEHYVRLTFIRGPQMKIRANHQSITVSSWLTKDASKARFTALGQVESANGVSMYAAYLALTDDEEEYLTMGARWP